MGMKSMTNLHYGGELLGILNLPITILGGLGM